ncbi:bacteriocin-like prepeptide [Ligilactobacillus murinus]|uniref:DUF5976 family putative bacteriocin n=1 Tax=Ligilactobacillus murinus TaxID=1622 RepID=UPI001434C612|nr:bacteriocin [Ligilactobacillus murinus]BDI01243.1 bacteriocin-like prepeptide [Ligilactobacillus murinus]GFI62938.1 hypothetical protein IMSAG117_00344 [Lactobacillaceae bacterium]
MKKLWNWWLAGGIKGKKRYVIFTLLEAVGVPFGLWLDSGREVSFLHFVTTPQMLLFVALCLTCAAPSLYFLDNIMGEKRFTDNYASTRNVAILSKE